MTARPSPHGLVVFAAFQALLAHPGASLAARSAATTAMALFLGLAAVLAGCQRGDVLAGIRPASSAAPMQVQRSSVAEQPMPEYLLLTGTLAAFQQADVAANATGRVVSMLVERGQSVKMGDVLASLDARSASLLASAAASQSKLAHNQMELAKRECARAQSLFDTGSLSQAEYDRLMTQCTNSQYAAAAAEANQLIAAKSVGDSAIRAPFTGIVGDRYVNVGEFVLPASRVVALYNIDPLRLELTVPEAAVSSIHPNTPVQFSVTAYEGALFTGTIRFVSPNIRKTSRDMIVEAVVPNPDGKLRPGMFAAARFLAGEKKVTVVPLSAVRKSEGSLSVFAISGSQAEERVVQLGEEKNGVVAVLGGLTRGEAIIDAPPADLRDGTLLQ